MDYSTEPTTLVVFELQDLEETTLLSVVELGFDQIPAERRFGAFRMNSGGWDQQMTNVEKHVAAASGPLEISSLKHAAPVFAALGDETRLRLVASLSDGGTRSIAQLTSGTAITRQAVTKHLRVLAAAGLVRDVRAGRERLWEFDASRLLRARRSLELIAEQWDAALDRLKTLVEGDDSKKS